MSALVDILPRKKTHLLSFPRRRCVFNIILIRIENSKPKKDTPVKYYLRRPTPYHNTVDPDYSPTSSYPDPSPIW